MVDIADICRTAVDVILRRMNSSKEYLRSLREEDNTARVHVPGQTSTTYSHRKINRGIKVPKTLDVNVPGILLREMYRPNYR